MKNKRIVLAIGGNGIVDDKGSASVEVQLKVIKKTAEQIVELISSGYDVLVSFGNGPQVGNLLQQQFEADQSDPMPLDVCVAMTQGMIGYWMQQAIQSELVKKKIQKKAATLLTQVKVDKNDPAFNHPSKQIGPIYSQEEAKRLEERTGLPFKEEKGKGYRMVAASPKPLAIVEEKEILELLDQGAVVIAAGGGGIPVIENDGRLLGKAGVIDKDWTSVMLAERVGAEMVLLLSKAEYVYLHYNEPNEQKLEKISVTEVKEWIQKGSFAEGSMLPKMEAGVAFTESKPERTFIVASYEKAAASVKGETGTILRSS
jgi:carbamate kinase